MPSRNIIRRDIPESYYHVYARGASKENVFTDERDKRRFLQLFERYLTDGVRTSKAGSVYPNFTDSVKLHSYCLMDNHFHLFLYQQSGGDISRFMSSLMTSYVRYFNLRHKRTGSLFESRYKCSHIDEEPYFVHISRYIHLNPRHWKYYRYSSINYYRKGGEPEWLSTKKVLEPFKSRKEYMQFLYDYEDHKNMLAEIKYDLADE